MLTVGDKLAKRVFDIVLAVLGILLTWWLMLFAWVIAMLDTRGNGLFRQKRVGRNGKIFNVFKIRTMRNILEVNTTVTTSNDARITKSGIFFRRAKIDELPQLFNVLFGTMSFVGPRPDVEGFADKLTGDDAIILDVRPGITGPASIKYKNEEELLSRQEDPEKYNREIIWPDKVSLNKKYIKEWSLKNDIMYIVKTITG